MPPESPGELARALATWGPGVRVIRFVLLALATVAGVTVFFENRVLEALTLSMRSEGTTSSAQLAWGRHPLHSFIQRAHELGTAWPLILLLLFAGIRLIRIGADTRGRNLLSALQIRRRTELEAEILTHLQRKNDQFFSTRPIAEILSRLASDIDRALENREASMRLFRLIIMIGGNLYFFLLQDWRLAFAGILTCLIGALWMDRIAEPVGQTEKSLLEKNDRVRAQFEDLLRATPEVQVGDLFSASRTHLRHIQHERGRALTDIAELEARLTAVQGLANLLALSALFVVTLYFLEAQSPDAGMALVPIILKALPELFANASSIVLQRLSLVRARTSIERLMEFDSPAPSTSTPMPDPPSIDSIQLVNVTYQYMAPGGVAQGGIKGVTATFERGRWYAIVGPAGAGKTTVEQALVGRVQPQSGQVLIGGAPLERYTAAQRCRWMTLMPQRVALLDATIAENLLFGRDGKDLTLSAGELAIVEAAGLGDVCRRKALDLRPLREEAGNDLGRRVLGLRSVVREKLKDLGLTVKPYGGEASNPDQWIIEQIFHGRCDRPAVVERLVTPRAERALQTVAKGELGRALIARGHTTVSELAHLLRIDSYAQFSKLTPIDLDVPVWELWRLARTGAVSDPSRSEQVNLIKVALTSPGRLPGSGAPLAPLSIRDARSEAALRTLTGDLWEPFDEARIHPYLSWRENLLFGSVEVRNERLSSKLESMLLDRIRSEGLSDAFTQAGMRYNVGPSGVRLSGGQGQLVALCRALIRATPVLVLDEPTSALDPVSRQRVVALLHAARKSRIVITVSHDPAFVRESDELIVMDRGHLQYAGPTTLLESRLDNLGAQLPTPVKTPLAVRTA